MRDGEICILMRELPVHKSKSQLTLPPPNLVRIIYILVTHIAEVLTYQRVVLGWQILEEDLPYRLILDCGSWRTDCVTHNVRSVEPKGGLACAAKSGF